MDRAARRDWVGHNTGCRPALEALFGIVVVCTPFVCITGVQAMITAIYCEDMYRAADPRKAQIHEYALLQQRFPFRGVFEFW
jgi:hypothetical protein